MAVFPAPSRKTTTSLVAAVANLEAAPAAVKLAVAAHLRVAALTATRPRHRAAVTQIRTLPVIRQLMTLPTPQAPRQQLIPTRARTQPVRSAAMTASTPLSRAMVINWSWRVTATSSSWAARTMTGRMRARAAAPRMTPVPTPTAVFTSRATVTRLSLRVTTTRSSCWVMTARCLPGWKIFSAT